VNKLAEAVRVDRRISWKWLPRRGTEPPPSRRLRTGLGEIDQDLLFQQYTIEKINEATQIYIMAPDILGTNHRPSRKRAE
jgi:hypothetical protein